jgi:hypothetical protein
VRRAGGENALVIWQLVIGLGSGLCIGALLLALSRRTKRWSPRWSVQATRELELAISRDETVARARRALEGLQLVAAPTVEDGTVEGEVPASWKTMGNTITIHVGERDGTTVAVVSSRPTFPQRFDWGRSRSLVDAVAARLTDGS